MNLPCDAVTVLMVITFGLIYVNYLFLAFILINCYNPVHVSCIILICTVYTCSGVACPVNLLYICLYRYNQELIIERVSLTLGITLIAY